MNDPLTVMGDSIDAFEDCWQRGEEPAIDTFLPAEPTARLVALGHLVHIDLEYRLRKGEAVRVEAYMARYAELPAQQEVLLELVAWEFHLRQQREPGLTVEEYRRRFPQLDLSLSQLIRSDSKPKSSGAATLPATAGRYRLEGEIARGAMGRIVRVRDEDFDRPLAMKILLGRGANLEARFLREARMSGELQHPGIPPVHALGRLDDGRPYFVMKLVQGQSLQELLRSKNGTAATKAEATRIEAKSALGRDVGPTFPLGRDEADTKSTANEQQPPSVDFPTLVTIFKSICDTVGYAHSRGVIHRDLKPENIMVGAFGEVQVMDWGLAKKFEEKETAAAGDNPAKRDSVHRTEFQGNETVVGSIMGTPSYMAPEQARGEIGGLDVRADVFGLGAILCEMLTGRPVYEGGSLRDVLRKAVLADLGDALHRLSGCGADVELIDLTRRCLSANKEDRPANGSEVAAAIAAYRADLEIRLKQAEIDRASERARADEEQKRRQAEHANVKAERKRRQMTVVVAVGSIVSLAAASAAGFWFQEDRVRQRMELETRQKDINKEIDEALGQATKEQETIHNQLRDPMAAQQLISDIEEWKASLKRARAAWERAKGVATAGDFELLSDHLAAKYQNIERKLKTDEADWLLAEKLDNARLQSIARLKSIKFFEELEDFDHTMDAFARAFGEFGVLDVKQNPEAVAEKMRDSRLRYVLLACLDHWAAFAQLAADLLPGLRERYVETRGRLRAIARLCESEDRRDEFFRDDHLLGNPTELAECVRNARLEAMPPGAIIAVAMQLRTSSRDEYAAFLRRAVAHHPRDFWLHFFQSAFGSDASDTIGNAKAAVAIRPRSGGAAAFLGLSYSLSGDHDSAVVLLQKAIELEPKLAMAHAFLGVAQRAKNDRKGAIDAWRKTIAFDRDYPVTQLLGKALLDDGKVDEAIDVLRRALEAYPSSAFVRDALGVALHKKGDLDGAIAHLQEAVDLTFRSSAEYLVHLGEVFLATNDRPKAIDIFREATIRAPNYAPAYEALGGALLERGAPSDLQSAIALLRKAISLAPMSAGSHLKLGVALSKRKSWTEAEEHLQKAVDLDPHSAEAHCLLGEALFHDKQTFRAVAHFQKAIAISPALLMAREGLGLALFERGDLEKSLENLRVAIAIDSNSTATRHIDRVLLKAKELDAEADNSQVQAAANPLDSDLQYRFGVALRKKQDLTGAIAQFRKAFQANPQNVASSDALAHALYDDGRFDEAIAQFRIGIGLDPNAIARRERVAELLRSVNDLPGAIGQYKAIAAFSATDANRLRAMGRRLQNADAPADAIDCFRGAIASGIRDAAIHADLGAALIGVGQFAEARASLLRALEQLPVGDTHRESASDNLKRCDRLMDVERKWNAFVKGGAMPSNWSDQIALAEMCRSFKRDHGAAARFYEAAFKDRDPQFRVDIGRIRFDAARSALLAAADKGVEPGKGEAADPSKLRRQALGLLHAELNRYKNALSGRRLETRLDIRNQLTQWRQDGALASIREAAPLAILPAPEQAAWRTLWVDFERVMKLAPTPVSEKVVRGTLTDSSRERTLALNLAAGQTCVIELFSLAGDFRPDVHLRDSRSVQVAETRKFVAESNAVHLVHTSQIDAAYSVAASSFQARDTGPYVLTIRVFDGKAR